MSRGGNDDYEESFPNEGAFWWNNAMRAMKGKRGRKALAELREALLMLPEKRLVAGAISTASLAAKVEGMPDQIEGWDYRTRQRAMRPSYEKQDCREKVEKEGIGVCAVGAYLLRKRVLDLGETPEEAMKALPSASDAEGMYLDATADLGTAAGLSFPVAYLLADRNDETYHSCTPEERYEKFLAWLDKELGLVPTGGGEG